MSTEEPIVVRDSVAVDATWSTIRVVIIFLSGAVLSHYLDNEAVVASGVAAVTAVTTYGFGMWKTVRSHWNLRHMASMLPDSIASVK